MIDRNSRDEIVRRLRERGHDLPQWQDAADAVAAMEVRDNLMSLTDEIVRLRGVEELYNAGLKQWEPVYKIALEDLAATRKRLEQAEGLLRRWISNGSYGQVYSDTDAFLKGEEK